MAKKLPWFKLYAQDLMADRRFRNLSGQQMGAYLWLLCEQWTEGDIPFDVIEVTPGMPKGIDDTAIAFVMQTFFPPDPDTNRRRNPRLAEQQTERAIAYAARVEAAAEARKARARKSLQDNAVSSHQNGDQGEKQNQNQKQITTTKELRSSTSFKDAISHWKKLRG